MPDEAGFEPGQLVYVKREDGSALGIVLSVVPRTDRMACEKRLLIGWNAPQGVRLELRCDCKVHMDDVPEGVTALLANVNDGNAC